MLPLRGFFHILLFELIRAQSNSTSASSGACSYDLDCPQNEFCDCPPEPNSLSSATRCSTRLLAGSFTCGAILSSSSSSTASSTSITGCLFAFGFSGKVFASADAESSLGSHRHLGSEARYCRDKSGSCRAPFSNLPPQPPKRNYDIVLESTRICPTKDSNTMLVTEIINGTETEIQVPCSQPEVPKAKCNSITADASTFCAAAGNNGFYASGYAAEIECVGETCTQELDATQCCKPDAKCNSITTPLSFCDFGIYGNGLIEAAATTYCDGLTCVQGTDASTCCKPDVFCNSITTTTTPTLLEFCVGAGGNGLIDLAASTECAAKTGCTVADDASKCCKQVCPTGSLSTCISNLDPFTNAGVSNCAALC